MRFCVDWDDDLFVCPDARPGDALNIMHSGNAGGYSATQFNLHYLGIVASGLYGGSASIIRLQSPYGIRAMNVATGYGPNAGAYFGFDGTYSQIYVTYGGTYTSVCYVKATAGAGTPLLCKMKNGSGSTTVTLTSDWQRVSWTWTATGNKVAFELRKDGSGTNVTFQATGYMVLAGSSAPDGFNLGLTSNLYDNITDRVKSAAWQLGKTGWSAKTIAEGTANLTLDNDDRRYSPENGSSPLAGAIGRRRLLTIECLHPSDGNYVTLWRGWTDRYKPGAGSNRSRELQLSAVQGKFQLDEAVYRQQWPESGTLKTLTSTMLLSTYISTASPYQATLNRNELGAAYAPVLDELMTLDPAFETFTVYADDWKDASVAKIIEQLNDVERGWWYIARDGKFVFRNRTYYYDPDTRPAATAINLDNQAVSAEYLYADGYANVVEVTYRPRQKTADAVVWSTKEAIYVRGRENKHVDIEFESDEERQLAVTALNTFTQSSNPSQFTATRGASTVGGVQASAELLNGRARLTLYNSNTGGVKVSVTLKGTRVDKSGGAVVREVSSELRSGVVARTFDYPLIADETTAYSVAGAALTEIDREIGQIDRLTVMSRDDDWLERALDVSTGDRVTLSETQTAHSGSEYYVCGEQHEWQPGLLRSTLVLYPLERNAYWIVGTSELGVDTWMGY